MGVTSLASMTLEAALLEWSAKRRRMGCVSATRWLCRRVPGYWAERLDRHTASGELYQHVVATNGVIRIDLAPHADRPQG